ncbi:ATP-binding protein [Roseovarius nitratireducens]|uniref:ATP-binding protein n=1 Tax=Roseovarius nitratireducens TaxID=2044597 RepID=UPI000CE1CE3F|nr:ATP-binding protein [Roseovarius nitratireducens]
MTRKRLDSLRVQILLLIIGSLLVAQAISLWLFVDERSLAVRAAIGAEAAGRAANVALLLERAPPDLHTSILRAADSPLARFRIDPQAAVDHLDHRARGVVEARIRSLLGSEDSREIRVELHEVDRAFPPMKTMSPQITAAHEQMMHDKFSGLELTLSIALADSTWLNVDTRFQRPPLQWPVFSAVSFGLTAALLIGVACWYLLARLTWPLRRLAQAADSIGRGEESEPLPVAGPSEVRNLTDSFNRMQERLVRTVADKTRIMAALGHDLRSPLTALRVHAEMVDEEETRDALVKSIEEMQVMVERTLAFSRGMAINEPPETVELGKFLTELKQDMLNAFRLEAGAPLQIRLRPQSMRRALRNIIENAVRYGEGVEVTYSRQYDRALIWVRDHGPGIPDTQLEEVFEPFYRVETSRSRETGGTGLGLSIARTILRSHGGNITLRNHPDGGLLVRLDLPFSQSLNYQERTRS